jgi:uncharacterized Zn finger protein
MELKGKCEECGTINEYEVEGKDVRHPLQVPCDNCGAWITMEPMKPPRTYKKKEARATASV